jgi:hypothetical protein
VPVVFIIAIAAVLVGVYLAATGRGGEMAYAQADHAPIDLGPVSAADIALLRPPTALWGYNMQVTDEALDRIARAVRDRDVRIAVLQEQLARQEPGAVPAIPLDVGSREGYGGRPFDPALSPEDAGFPFTPESSPEFGAPDDPEASYLPEAGESYSPESSYAVDAQHDQEVWPESDPGHHSEVTTDPDLPAVPAEPDLSHPGAATIPEITLPPAGRFTEEAAPDSGAYTAPEAIHPTEDPSDATTTPTPQIPLAPDATSATDSALATGSPQTPLILKASAPKQPSAPDPAEPEPTQPSPVQEPHEATQPSPALSGNDDDPQAPYDTQGPQGSYDTHGWRAQQQEAAQSQAGDQGPKGESAEEEQA